MVSASFDRLLVLPQSNCELGAGSPGVLATDDSELMGRIGRGDHDAFALLLERHSEAARTLALRLVRDADVADDIVQEVFLAVWAKPQSWQPVGSLRAWLMTLVSRRIIDLYRRRWPSQLESDERGEFAGEPVWTRREVSQPIQAMDKESSATIAKALDSLSVRHRMILLLYYYEGLSVVEVAASLEISRKAAESLLARAREALRQILISQRFEPLP